MCQLVQGGDRRSCFRKTGKRKTTKKFKFGTAEFADVPQEYDLASIQQKIQLEERPIKLTDGTKLHKITGELNMLREMFIDTRKFFENHVGCDLKSRANRKVFEKWFKQMVRIRKKYRSEVPVKFQVKKYPLYIKDWENLDIKGIEDKLCEEMTAEIKKIKTKRRKNSRNIMKELITKKQMLNEGAPEKALEEFIDLSIERQTWLSINKMKESYCWICPKCKKANRYATKQCDCQWWFRTQPQRPDDFPLEPNWTFVPQKEHEKTYGLDFRPKPWDPSQ